MTRSSTEIEHIKRTVSLRELVEAHGVKLVRRGANFVGRCPFGTHEDRTPSFIISKKNGIELYHCMGCAEGGDVIRWVERIEGVEFREAVRRLEAILGKNPPPPLAEEPPAAGPADLEDHQVLDEVTGHYQRTLCERPEALGYLERRGIGQAELIERFRIGYSDRSLPRLLSSATAEGKSKIDRLVRLGVLRSGGQVEHLGHHLVFPLVDLEGRVHQLYGRARMPPRKGISPHRCLPGPHRAVFHPEAVALSEELHLCEAIIDALTLLAASPAFSNTSATLGVDGFLDEHLRLMREFGTKRVILCFDADAAGDRGALAIAKRLKKDGISCYRAKWPKGMDANQYAMLMKPAANALGLVLRGAEPMLGAPARPELFPVSNSTIKPATKPERLGPSNAAREEAAALFASSAEPRELEAPTRPAPLAAMPDASQVATLAVSTDVGAKASGSSSSTAEVTPVAETNSMPGTPPAMALAPPLGKLEPVVPAKPAPPPSSLPPVAPSGLQLREAGDELHVEIGPRRYRLRGLKKNLSPETLRLNIFATAGAGIFVDHLDLYSARQRASFVTQAAQDLALDETIIKKDVDSILVELDRLQSEKLQAALSTEPKVPPMSEEERNEALQLLQDPKLLDRVLEDLEAIGVVGEETNKLLAFLGAVSRKLDDPLAIIVQSPSGAGKSSLTSAIQRLIPEEELCDYTALTPQALYYMGPTNLRHKLLALTEEEGAERASYPLKILQSEKQLKIASPTKDPSGRIVTQDYLVEGPVALFLTTTAYEVDEELYNRCVILAVDEDRAQTQAIHRRQRTRETAKGLLAKGNEAKIVRLHQNAQRLLVPLQVVNPFAETLTFVDHKTRTRRDHMKYLVLMRAIALLHQHQRPKKVMKTETGSIEYIEVTRGDIELCNQIAPAILGRALEELPPQTEKLLHHIERLVKRRAEAEAIEPCSVVFTRREAGLESGFGLTQLKLHLRRLEELEHIVVRGHKGQRFEYQLGRLDPATGRGPGQQAKSAAPHRNSSTQLDNSLRQGDSGADRSGTGRGDGRTNEFPSDSIHLDGFSGLLSRKGMDTGGGKNGVHRGES